MDKIYHACFEIANYTGEQRALLETYFLNQENNCNYLVYKYITDENGFPSIQGYIQWTIAKQYHMLEQEWNAKFKTANASAIENIKLCKGEVPISSSIGRPSSNEMQPSNIFVEMGNFRDIAGHIARSRDNRRRISKERKWEIILRCARDGNFMEIDPKILIKYYNNIMQIYEDNHERPADLNGELQNLWIWGPSGTGKSKLARMIAKDKIYSKNKNKYWHNYKGEDWIIIEDIEINDQWIGIYLRLWGDRYGFNAELKTGSKYIRPKHIIVTSSYSIKEIFSEEKMNGRLDMRNVLLRRFDSEYLLRFGNEPVTIEQLTEMRNQRWRSWNLN